MPIVKCSYCGREREAQPCKAKNTKHFFCSRSHRWKAVREGLVEHNGCRPVEERFWEKTEKLGPEECWEWKGAKSNGYGTLYFMGRVRKATLVSYFLHHGVLPPDGRILCHKCDNPGCVNPDHLFAGTNLDNNLDCVSKGRHRGPKSTEHPLSKLSKDDVATIKNLLATGNPRKSDIAKTYGVTRKVIHNISHGISYKDVP